jgi:hypothetical protein
VLRRKQEQLALNVFKYTQCNNPWEVSCIWGGTAKTPSISKSPIFPCIRNNTSSVSCVDTLRIYTQSSTSCSLPFTVTYKFIKFRQSVGTFDEAKFLQMLLPNWLCKLRKFWAKNVHNLFHYYYYYYHYYYYYYCLVQKLTFDSATLKEMIPNTVTFVNGLIIEICGLLGNYTASCGNYLPTFRDNVSVPSSRVKIPSRTTDFINIATEAWNQGLIIVCFFNSQLFKFYYLTYKLETHI